ncbi:MAG: helix-turn-helix domain-containing protein [Comamonas sp.]|nr:helix-turn-helix domain-containing protein [Comamonas sp.]
MDVPPQLIGQWSDGSRPIPSARCPSIELATGGAVTCDELLPNLTWYRIPDAAWPHPLGRPALDFCPPTPTSSARAATETEVAHG